MKKSFTEVFKDSLDIFREVFWRILGIYISFGVLAFICGIIGVLILGRDVVSLIMTQTASPGLVTSMLPQFVSIIFLAFVLLFLFYLIGFWTVLIIRNNLLIGKGLLKESFSEAFIKIWKLIFLMIIVSTAFVIISVLTGLVLDKYAVILIVPFIIFCVPLGYTACYGILCSEGKFWTTVCEAVSLGIKNWFKIAGYIILFGICLMAAGLVVMVLVKGLSQTNGLALLGRLLLIAFQFAVSIFSTCFYTVFYLDLADIKPQEKGEYVEEAQTPQEKITQNN